MNVRLGGLLPYAAFAPDERILGFGSFTPLSQVHVSVTTALVFRNQFHSDLLSTLF
jgi:hypothetical protein